MTLMKIYNEIFIIHSISGFCIPKRVKYEPCDVLQSNEHSKSEQYPL